MPTNHYFSTAPESPTTEQDLLEDLIGEAIQIYGMDVQYLLRESRSSIDQLYGEDPTSQFSRAYTVEMYLANVEGFEGGGDMFSKFGLDIQDTTNMIVARKAFNMAVPSNLSIRPKEGDLVYIPLFGKIFEVKFVEKKVNFYSLGKRTPYIYELRCDLFRYSHEKIETGDADIDAIVPKVDYTIQVQLGSGSGNYNIGERVYQGTDLASSTVQGTVKSWNNGLKILELVQIEGQFANTSNVIGSQSQTQYTTTAIDDTSEFRTYGMSDNKNAQTELDNILNLNDVNPLGNPS